MNDSGTFCRWYTKMRVRTYCICVSAHVYPYLLTTASPEPCCGCVIYGRIIDSLNVKIAGWMAFLLSITHCPSHTFTHLSDFLSYFRFIYSTGYHTTNTRHVEAHRTFWIHEILASISATLHGQNFSRYETPEPSNHKIYKLNNIESVQRKATRIFRPLHFHSCHYGTSLVVKFFSPIESPVQTPHVESVRCISSPDNNIKGEKWRIQLSTLSSLWIRSC